MLLAPAQAHNYAQTARTAARSAWNPSVRFFDIVKISDNLIPHTNSTMLDFLGTPHFFEPKGFATQSPGPARDLSELRAGPGLWCGIPLGFGSRGPVVR